MSFISIPSEFRVDDLNTENIKKNIMLLCEKHGWSRYLVTQLDTSYDCNTNLREDLFSSFFTFNISVDSTWKEEYILKVETRGKVHGNSDWVSKTLSMDIDREFMFATQLLSLREWKYVDRSEEELIENIQEILHIRAQECLFFQNEFVK